MFFTNIFYSKKLTFDRYLIEQMIILDLMEKYMDSMH